MAPIVAAVVQAFDKACEFGTETMKGMDPEKYSNAVNNMYAAKNNDAIYDDMAQVIMNSTTYSDDEKLEKLQELANKQQTSQMDYAKSNAKEINVHEEKRGKIAVQVVAGVLTAGVSLIPTVISYANENKNDKVVDFEKKKEA